MSILSFAASAVFHPAFIEVVSIFVVALIASFIYKADNHRSDISAPRAKDNPAGANWQHTAHDDTFANGEVHSKHLPGEGAGGQQTTHEAAFANTKKVPLPDPVRLGSD